MSQKLLKEPARLLLIAFVAIPAMTVAGRMSTPRMSVRPPASQSTTIKAAAAQPRQHIYFNEGIERWGLNE